jgi:hypothetical protein
MRVIEVISHLSMWLFKFKTLKYIWILIGIVLSEVALAPDKFKPYIIVTINSPVN